MKTNCQLPLLSNGRPRALLLAGLVCTLVLFAAAPCARAQGMSYALSFDGTDTYVDLGTNAPVLGPSFTEEAWINPQISESAPHGFLGDDGAPSLFVVNGTGLQGGFGSGTNRYCWITGNVLQSNAWNHVAATYDGAVYRVYVNGQQVLTTNFSGAVPSRTPVRHIGEVATKHFPGQVDEVRLWNVARSQAQIMSTMRSPLTGTEPNLIAYWRFDEGSGTNVFDATTNGYNGVLTNGPLWTVSTVPQAPVPLPPPFWGTALSFDGVGDYVDLGSSAPVLGTHFTEEAWIMSQPSDNEFHGILGYGQLPDADYVQYRAPSLFVFNGTCLQGGFGDSTNWIHWETGSVLHNPWNHVAATYDGASYCVYVNGAQVLSNNFVDVPCLTPVRHIGEVAGKYFPGQIDEVRLWNVARTADQIQADMTNLLTGTEAGLVAYWKFDEAAGITVGDVTSKGHDGFLMNAQAWAVSSLIQVPAAPPPWGYALSFDGTNDYVDLGTNAPGLGTAFTEEAWINPQIGDSGFHGFLGDDGAPSLYVFNGTSLCGGFGTGANSHFWATSSVLWNNTWNHVAATYDGAVYLVYVNGQQVLSNYVGAVPDLTPVRDIGQVDGYFFPGQIDEVRLWNAARSQAQIASSMYGSLTGTEPNLLAYWRFDEGAGTNVFDATTNGHNGVLVNGPSWTVSTAPQALAPAMSPFWGAALSFDGTNGYVDLGPGAPVLGIQFTEEAWIKPQISDSGFHGFLGNDGAPSLFVFSGTSLCGGFGTGANPHFWSTYSVLQNNVWNHVAATYDGAVYRVYVNGQQVLSNYVGAVPGLIPVRYIGQVDGYFFPGQIDEVRLWNVARSQAQIAASMQWPLTGTEPNLVAYWRFDEGQGTTAFDATTHGYNGVLINGPSWTLSTVPRARGSALSFSGGGGIVVTNLGAALPTNEVTVEFWQLYRQAGPNTTFSLNPDQTTNRFVGAVPWTSGQVYWDFGDITQDGRLAWSPSPALPVNTWEHFAFVAKAGPDGYMEIYANGVLVASRLRNSPVKSFAGSDLWLGCLSSSSGALLNGELDEFRIWNVARTAAQIQADMTHPLTGTEAGLVACYRLDEGGGATAYDATPNHFNGTLVNGPKWANSTAPYDWMSAHLDTLGNRPLKTLFLPCSHDSAMYQYDISLLQFSVIWWLDSHPSTIYSFDDETASTVAAGINSHLPFGIPAVSAGDIEGPMKSKADDLAITQDISIGDQLAYGIRYFDLRPKLQDGTWYLYHGETVPDQDISGQLPDGLGDLITVHLEEVSVTGPLLDDVLSQVQDFVQNHRELVILNFSHYQEKNTYPPRPQDFTNETYVQLVTMITNRLGPWLYYSLPPGKRLADVTLGEYLANPNHGTVLVVCDRDGSDTDYPINNPTAGIWPWENYNYWWTNCPSPLALRVYDNYTNSPDYDAVKADQLAKFQSFGTTWGTNRTDICDLFSIAWGAANDGSTPLYVSAAWENPRYAGEMLAIPQPNPQGRILNLLGGDYVENSHVAELAVYLNTAPWRPTLSARRLWNQIELSVGAVYGMQIQLEQTTNLANPVWTPVQTNTITSVPQLITVPMPEGGQAFWRAVVR